MLAHSCFKFEVSLAAGSHWELSIRLTLRSMSEGNLSLEQRSASLDGRSRQLLDPHARCCWSWCGGAARFSSRVRVGLEVTLESGPTEVACQAVLVRCWRDLYALLS